VESPRSPKRATTVGNSEGQISVQIRYGVGVDDKWEYHSVREAAPGRKPVETRTSGKNLNPYEPHIPTRGP